MKADWFPNILLGHFHAQKLVGQKLKIISSIGNYRIISERGIGNYVIISQTGTGNYVIISQTGIGNYVIISQASFSNSTYK